MQESGLNAMPPSTTQTASNESESEYKITLFLNRKFQVIVMNIRFLFGSSPSCLISQLAKSELK